MRGDQSRTLRVGDRVCWGTTTTDLGTVVGTSWSEVTIAWDDGEANSVSHNDMAQVERVPVKFEQSAEKNHMKTIPIAASIAALAMTAAIAETRSSEYFVVLDTKTKTCTVADKKPKAKTLKIVGDATYRTQAEAENGMKIIKVCISR